jgi:hypothetical protein
MKKTGLYHLTKTGYKSYLNTVNSPNEFDSSTHQLPGIGFKLTIDNNYDMEKTINKRS